MEIGKITRIWIVFIILVQSIETYARHISKHSAERLRAFCTCDISVGGFLLANETFLQLGKQRVEWF